MHVNDPELVLVRGINSTYFTENFRELCIGFGGAPQAIPKNDAYYVGLYLEAPVSAITHIGIVEEIDFYGSGKDYYLKAVVKLPEPVVPDHAIRKHENWKLSDLGLTRAYMEGIRAALGLP